MPGKGLLAPIIRCPWTTTPWLHGDAEINVEAALREVPCWADQTVESGIDGVTVYIRLLGHRWQTNKHCKYAKQRTVLTSHTPILQGTGWSHKSPRELLNSVSAIAASTATWAQLPRDYREVRQDFAHKSTICSVMPITADHIQAT